MCWWSLIFPWWSLIFPWWSLIFPWWSSSFLWCCSIFFAIISTVVFFLNQKVSSQLKRNYFHQLNCTLNHWLQSPSSIIQENISLNTKKYIKKSVCESHFVVFCSSLEQIDFPPILQDSFTSTGAIIRLPQCQWSNPERYGWVGYMKPSGTQCYNHNKTKHNQQNHMHNKTVHIFHGIFCTGLPSIWCGMLSPTNQHFGTNM